MHNFNEQLFLFINGSAGQSHMLDVFFVFISRVVVPLLLITSVLWFVFVLPIKKKEAKERLAAIARAGVLLLSLALVWFVVESIKGGVALPRPAQIIDGLKPLSPFGNNDSFPSAHTAFAFCVATFVYQYSKRIGFFLFAAAVLVGISRIVVGVHFPLDVIVGACLGIAIPWGVVALFKHYKI